MKNILTIFLAIFALSACNSANVNTEGFDIETWRKDKFGCEGKRIKMNDRFEQKIKPQLQGLSEMQVMDLLGRADAQELSKRNQKFYMYYLEPGKQCTTTDLQNQAQYIQIRFDALNRVNEVVTMIR